MVEKNADLIIRILEDQEERALEDEEIIHLLLDKKLSRNMIAEHEESLSFGNKAADAIARFVGGWPFIIIFIVCLVSWIILNTLLLLKAVDPYPFILLNLILSCIAALQAPIIMMSQNRQEEKDRLRALNDYKTNLKSEIIIEDLYEKIETLVSKQEAILQAMKKIIPLMADLQVDSSKYFSIDPRARSDEENPALKNLFHTGWRSLSDTNLPGAGKPRFSRAENGK